MIPAWKPELLWPKTMLLFERQAMSVAERAFSSAGVAIRQRIRTRQCEIIVLPHLKVDCASNTGDMADTRSDKQYGLLPRALYSKMEDA
jgi:hypothetical protein